MSAAVGLWLRGEWICELRSICLCFIGLSITANSAAACGQRTHVEMARRAVDDFLAREGDLLPGIDHLFDSDEVRAAFYCGAMFPDWGYQGIDPDAGEATHWHAFQEALFDLVALRIGPGEWTRDDRLRVAFFLGVVSHGVTDNPWHFSAPSRRSFLARARDEDGSTHSGCELVGDLVLHADRARRIRLDHDDLYWPVDEVLEALRASGHPTTRDRLRSGCFRMEATWRAAALGATPLLAALRGDHPWVVRHLEDYSFGGIAHGAAGTAVWSRHYYARFRGWYTFQDTPEYGRRAGEHCYTYAGCEDGEDPVLEVGPDRAPELRFDVSSIPPATEIASATLWLHAIAVPAGETRLVAPGAGEATIGGAGWVGLDATGNVRDGIGGGSARISLRATGPCRFDSSAAFDDSADGFGGGIRVAYRPLLVVRPAGR